MSLHLKEHARRFADKLLMDHPVLPAYADHITILLVGSLGAGYADELSDVDLWVLCSDEVSDSIGSKFKEAGLRFNELPPEVINKGSVDAHYFAFSLSRLRDYLELRDDYSLFLMTHGDVLHDPSGQFTALKHQYANLPADLLRDKVELAYWRVSQCAFSLEKHLRRFQPLIWLQNTEHIVKWSLELCCWLDGQAPVYPSWLMKQAQECSTSAIILPAVNAVLCSLGPAIEKGLSEKDCGTVLLDAAHALEKAAESAVEVAGYQNIPRWTPDDGNAHTR